MTKRTSTGRGVQRLGLTALGLALALGPALARGEEAAGETGPDASTAEAEPGDEEASTEEEEEETPRSRQFGHRYQAGIGLVAGSGYRFEVAYGGDYCYQDDDNPYDEPSVCNGRSPVFFDFQLAFGVTDGLEVLLEYRLGLLEEHFGGEEHAAFTTGRPMAIGVGVRYFVSPLSRFKFFIGALLDIDFTRTVKTDVFVRPVFGFQIEIVRWVAFFVQVSVNLSFVRSFSIGLDGGGGFQFRFP